MNKSKTSFFIKIEIPQEISCNESYVDLIKKNLEHHIQTEMENYYMLREDKSKINNIPIKIISTTTNI